MSKREEFVDQLREDWYINIKELSVWILGRRLKEDYKKLFRMFPRFEREFFSALISLWDHEIVGDYFIKKGSTPPK